MAGVAIAAMHYVGMSAFSVQGHLVWDVGTMLASAAAAVTFSAIAALLPLHRTKAVRLMAPAALLTAVCALHFTGMTAVSIEFDPAAEPPAGGIEPALLAILIANVAAVIVALSLASVWLAIRDRSRRIAEESRVQDLADLSVEGLLLCDGDRVVGMNRSFEHTAGVGRDQLVGRSIDAFLPGFLAGAPLAAGEVDALLHLDGAEPIPVRAIAKIVEIAGRRRTVVAIRDQRERITIENRMRELAHSDPLTGLANRLTFSNDVAGRFAATEASARAFALLMVDLDRFKSVNDTLGHAVGDEVLRRVAKRLKGAAGERDLVARLGGDEFAIVAGESGDAVAAAATAERVIDVLSRPFVIDGQIVEIGASVGLACAPADGDTTEALSRSADLALYRAKEDGRGVMRFFEQEMNARMIARREFEHDLRRALGRDEFEVVYQPQVCAQTGRFDGAEALLRWNHPVRGSVSPADFIPLAEDLGLIVGIGEFVLRRACAEAMRWPAPLSVSVNLSPVQLRDVRLAATVASALEETGLDPTRLELELTENAILDDDGKAISVLHAIRSLGVRIAMDDFGTGYSSISYLRRFPFDKIKIDRSFVSQLPNSQDGAAVIHAVATLGARLGMKVTAEGVETDEQRRFAIAEGCDQLQGFLMSKPVHASEASRMFAEAFARPSAA